MRLRLSLALLAGLVLGSQCAFGQDVASPQVADAAFTGIHRHKGADGSAETVTITDGRAYRRITEQEYRERGYAPEFEHLPTIYVQRLPVRVHVPARDLD